MKKILFLLMIPVLCIGQEVKTEYTVSSSVTQYDIINNRGVNKDSIGDYEGAIVDYNKAIKLNPNYYLAYANRGVTKHQLKDYNGAIADYDKAIELDPNDSYALYYRGMSKSQLKDYNGAIADFTKAIELDPNDAVTYNNLSWYIHLSGDSKEALKICNKGIKINSELPILYITRGEIKLGIDDSSEIRNGLGLNDKFGACEDWQKAKSLRDLENIAQDYLSKYCN